MFCEIHEQKRKCIHAGDEETMGFIFRPHSVEAAQEDHERDGENIKEKGSYKLNTNIKLKCQLNLMLCYKYTCKKY